MLFRAVWISNNGRELRPPSPTSTKIEVICNYINLVKSKFAFSRIEKRVGGQWFRIPEFEAQIKKK